MAELIENPARGSDSRERDSTPQNLQGSPWNIDGGWGRSCLGISRKRDASGWTIAKRRNIERAHYESWCRDARMLFCNSPGPRHLLFARARRKFRISGSPRYTPPEIAKVRDERGMRKGFCRPATGYLRKRSDGSVTLRSRGLISCRPPRRRGSVRHQFYRATDREKAAPMIKNESHAPKTLDE